MKKLISFLLAAILVCGTIPAVFASDAGVQLGVVKENRYENEALNLACTLGENWVFLDQEQVMELMGYTGEMLGDDYQELLKQAQTYIDAYAYNAQTGDTVNITVEKLNPLNAVIMTEKKYIELSKESLISALSELGVTGLDFTSGTGKIGGQEHGIITLRGNANGSAMVETLGVIKHRNQIIVITCAGADEDIYKEVFAGISFPEEEK